MRCIEIREPGGPEVLQLTSRPRPIAGPGEVLIRVMAAGVNRPDVLQRQGAYPPPPGASDLPGLEVAGVIEACGSDVTEYQVGDSVCALLAGGGYAEWAVAPAGQCLPVPQGWSFVEAAGLPETWFTVWSNLIDRAGLQPGESVLIHGAASGIGTAAIQLARWRGARVFGTAGSAERCTQAQQLGAECVIPYREQDFVEQVLDRTAGRGVDVILDMVAGDYTARNIKALADDGRLVIIALLRGARAEVDLGQILRRRLTITGSTLRQRPVAFKAQIARALRHSIWPAMSARQIQPTVSVVLDLSEAAEAHRRLEAGEVFGKVVLQVGPGL